MLARAAPAAQIVPFVRFGFNDPADNEYGFRFGYDNSGAGVIIPSGLQNFVFPGSIFQGQPNVFSACRYFTPHPTPHSIQLIGLSTAVRRE
jgi:hypothetical protein